MAHGDYASGVALAKAKQAGMAPRILAEKLVESMGPIEGVHTIDIAGPGFINFTLTAEAVSETVVVARSEGWGKGNMFLDKKFVFEYTDPNPFKAFHIGHLMSNAIGESLSRIAAYQSADVIRANYQGDVGVHVACAIWGIKKLGIHPESADEFGRAYAEGATAYKVDAYVKSEIDEINRKLYDRSDAALNELYDTGRKESLAAFEKIYAMLGTRFDRYYFESETAPIGKEIVLARPDIFTESEGARVFVGEAHGLHTRVFLSSKGLPTYEAKELGLEKLKQDEYPDAAAFVIVTANEVTDYFRVVKKAMELVYPAIAQKLTHIAHGMMKLPTGKMSSRTGDVITGESLLADLSAAAHERAKESRADDAGLLAQHIAVSAIKFQILKQTTSKDIIFDREQALSLEGDSGPYLQYAFARTRAIAHKAQEAGIMAQVHVGIEPNMVSRLLVRFPSVTERAAREYAPHHIAQYLLELAGAFNSWYAQEQILDGTSAAEHKLALTEAVGNTLKTGLSLLGIPAPEKM
jgi:arginyl-tRNA synthetase